jgi:N-acyl homoserine lactone hydrolase
VKVHAETKPLDAPLQRGRAGASVVVEPLEVGKIRFPHSLMVRTGPPFERLRMAGALMARAGWPSVPCPAFLIHHPSAGPFLVDTGLHPSVSAKPSANLGRTVASFGSPELAPGKDLPAQLRARGIDAREIRLVVMTHLHIDHASGMSEFPNATFVISAREWEAATTESRPLLRGYRPAHYDYVFDYRTLSYDGPAIGSYSTFGRTFDLFGDGSVRIVSTPGHSAGHQSVICRLRDRDFVIAGDVIYTLGQLGDTPLQPRPADPHTLRRSLQELRLFRRQYPQAVIVPGHDPDHWATLESRYE